ncbi:MAG: hypothetical protein AAF493_18575 [Pseudomonadota bacterium]
MAEAVTGLAEATVGAPPVLALGVALFVVTYGCMVALKTGDSKLSGGCLASLLGTCVGMFWLAPEFVVPRYLLSTVPVLALAMAVGLAHSLNRSGVPLTLASVALVGWLIATGFELRVLFSEGRGNYTAALQQMSQESRNTPLSFSSKADGRLALMLSYYASRCFSEPVLLVPFERSQATPPEWLIVESAENNSKPERSIPEYTYRGTFGSILLSGLAWSIYHRSPDEGGGARHPR